MGAIGRLWERLLNTAPVIRLMYYLLRVIGVAVLFSGCTFDTLGFRCSVDSQCGSAGGRCISSSCAFPSSICPSGFAWDKSAEKGRAGLCATEAVMPDLEVEAVDLGGADLTGSPAPTPQPLGAGCQLDSECESGACVDAVCCESACEGACLTCNDGAHPGHCEPVPDGQLEPHGRCSSTDPCGLDGTCQSGACALRPKDTVCAPQACAAGALTLTRRCDGAGVCVAGSTRSCDPYVCLPDGSDCYGQCSGANTGCKAPNSCTSGLCGKAQNGAVCSSPGACLSGLCTDGRCCASSSCNTCYACDIAGHEGSCYTTPAQTIDPRCASFDVSTCSFNGTCDGAGVCAYWPAGSECHKPRCYKCNSNPDSPDCAETNRNFCPGGGQACPSGAPTVLVCSPPSMCALTGVGDGVGCQ